ncbi:MAG: hypothetical protein ACI4HO_02175 [Ruminococcus sp.]
MKRSDIVNSLKEQLRIRGADISCFLDLINDYGDLWNIKNKLIRDIKKRGVTYEDVSSVGVPMTKNNPSTKELVCVNRQMLSILEKLNLSTNNCGTDVDDEL